MKNKVKISDFHEYTAERLKANPKELAEYKRFVLAEFDKDQRVGLLIAGFRTILAASVGKSSKAYKIIEKDNNPTLDNFLIVLKVLKLKLKIVAINK